MYIKCVHLVANNMLIWISHKRISGRAMLSGIPAVFLVVFEITSLNILMQY